MCTPGWIKETRIPDNDVVLFPQQQTCLTTVYADHIPSGFLCLDSRKRDDIKLLKRKKNNHSIAVEQWARPRRAIACALASKPQPLRTATKTSSPTVEMTSSTTICSCVRWLCSSSAPPTVSLLRCVGRRHGGSRRERVSLIFFRIPMIPPPLVRIPITLKIQNRCALNPKDSWIGACLNFHYFDTQSWVL